MSREDSKPKQYGRIEQIDLFRGLGVAAFIFWHSFDMLYNDNRFDVPLFRMLLFTTGTFVAVSGLVIGLERSKKRRPPLSVSLARWARLLAFPLAVAAVNALGTKSAQPLIAVIGYPVGMPSTFTFSILVVLGWMAILLPYIPTSRVLDYWMMGSIAGVGIMELFNGVLFTRFFSLFAIGTFFFVANQSVKRILGMPMTFGQFVLLSCWAMVMFSAVFINQYLYWYIRSRMVPHALFVLTTGVLVTQACSRYSRMLWMLRGLLLAFGSNSLFVYIFHYALLSMLTAVTGRHCFETGSTVAIGFGICFFCIFTLNKILPFIFRIHLFSTTYRIVFGKLNVTETI